MFVSDPIDDSPWLGYELMVLGDAMLLKLGNDTTPFRKRMKAGGFCFDLLKYLVCTRRAVVDNVFYDSKQIPFGCI